MSEYCGLRLNLYSYTPLQQLESTDENLEVKKEKDSDRAKNKSFINTPSSFKLLQTGEDFYNNVTWNQSIDHFIKTILLIKNVLLILIP